MAADGESPPASAGGLVAARGKRVVATIGRSVDEHLVWWVLGAVALGVLQPSLAAITDYATPILAVMVGSVSLTLTVARFRGVTPRVVGATLAGHALMPALAFAIAVALGLPTALVVGFVVLGAVTPELVTPTMTELAEGDTALAAVVLVLAGVAATAFVPLSLAALVGDAVTVDSARIVEGLVLAVVAPMLAALALRHRYDERLAPHESACERTSAVAVVVIICGVAAANADLLQAAPARTALVAVGALALNLLGYGVGYLAGVLATTRAQDPNRADDQNREQDTNRERDSKRERSRTLIATTLSVGMRDFAVAAALVVAAGLPPAASLPAVTFGVVEMTTSAAIASYATA